jgi:hypothetical protein
MKSLNKCLAVVLLVTMTLTGCVFQTSWLTEAAQIAQAAVPMITTVLDLIGAFQGTAVAPEEYQAVHAVSGEVKADLGLIQTLIAEYKAADDAAKPDVVSRINAAVTKTQDDLTQILPALHIKNQALQSKIAAIVGLVSSEVQSIAALLPVVNSGKVAAKKVGAAAKPMTAKQFKKTFSYLLTCPTGDQSVDGLTKSLAQ